MDDENLDKAVEAWQEILGDRIRMGSVVETVYTICTFPIKRKIPAVLIPLNTAEVVRCVHVANRFKIPIYPISTGNNWGYGSANPVMNGCVIVDLSQMNKILDMDPELGLITLQPGVSQGQLYRFLEEHRYPFMVPTTGAGPNCSIVGNILERGYGITPYTDHFLAMMSLEAVLANGEIYRSAHQSLGAKDISKVYRWGIGAYLDGLFSQSGFGIVTEMTVALARRPESIQSFIFSATDENLEMIVNDVHSVLSLLGHNIGGINLMNNRRVLAMRGIPYPHQRIAQDQVMDPDLLQELGKKYSVAEWTGFGAIYGTKKISKACQSRIKAYLKPHSSRLFFFSLDTIQWLKKGISQFPFTKKIVDVLQIAERGMEILHGKPNETALKLAYWKSGILPVESEDLEPDKNQCGLIWFAPLVPMNPNKARIFVNIVKKICVEFGIEPLITLSSLSDRCFDCTLPILFNLNNEKETKRARSCYIALFNECRKLGYFPYRLDVDSMQLITNTDDPHWHMLSRFKQAIDPNDIMSPGRYTPIS